MQKYTQKGFTIIELVMVVVLVGVMILVVSNIFTRTPIELDSQTRRLVNDLRFMQHKAMSRNIQTRINFSSTQYTLTEADGTTAINQPALNTNVVTLPNGVTLSTNLPGNMLVYNGLGKPFTDTSGTELTVTATITLTAGSSTETVNISPDTGRVVQP